MIRIEELQTAAQAGNLDNNLVAALRKVDAISAEQAEDLKATSKAARKAQNAANRAALADAAFNDVRRFAANAGMPGLLTRSDDGEVTISHGGHSVTFPATQTKRLGPALRAILSAVAGAVDEELPEEEAAPLSLVGS